MLRFRLVIDADAAGAVNFCDCTGSELFIYVKDLLPLWAFAYDGRDLAGIVKKEIC